MFLLTPALIRRLEARFPNEQDRIAFISSAIENALDDQDEALPLGTVETSHVGGTIHLYSDGGARGNPGPSGIGVVLKDPLNDIILGDYKEAIGHATNNEAEYKALMKGLELAKQYCPNELICHLDSELIVKQLSGAYRVKTPTLKPLFEQVQQLVAGYSNVSFVHIPRARNWEADALVNQALDALM
jgi:ribonuclease HI